MSKLIRFMLFLPLFISCCVVAHAAPGQGYTLVVAPARYSVLQVGFDVVARNPAVLVSYQGEASSPEPALHAWNGTEWVHISLQDFREVSFLEKMPSRTVLIGDDKTLPSVLADAASWSPDIIRVTSLTTSSLVNEFGRIFEWSPSEWKWFSERFNLTLEDESEPLRKSSWYDQPGPLYRPPLGDVIQLEHHKEADLDPAPLMDATYPSSTAPYTSEDVSMPPAEETIAPAEEVEAPVGTWSAPAQVGSDTIPGN